MCSPIMACFSDNTFPEAVDTSKGGESNEFRNKKVRAIYPSTAANRTPRTQTTAIRKPLWIFSLHKISTPIEKTIIDRCTRLVYRDYLQDPRPENMPILGDLYELLRKQSEPEAQNIATALEIYVNGSLNVFNHRSNIDMDSHRVLCFQLKSLGKALKEIGLLIMQDAVWNRVTANREKHKTTWFYIDEFHLLLKGQTGAFSVEIWKRFRKWGGIPSGLTQNVKDLLASREIENIFENSDFIYMLNQAQGDRQILAKQLGISPTQLSYVTHSGPGEGLLFFGNVIIPFVDHFPKDTSLYQIMTTRPEEVAEAGT